MELSLVYLLKAFQYSRGVSRHDVFGGTSFVTTLPAPTMAFSPTVMPPNRVAPEPIEAPCLTIVFWTLQSASV